MLHSDAAIYITRLSPASVSTSKHTPAMLWHAVSLESHSTYSDSSSNRSLLPQKWSQIQAEKRHSVGILTTKRVGPESQPLTRQRKAVKRDDNRELAGLT